MTLRIATSRLGETFRALRSRNYRLYFIGQAISLVGTWMERVAMGWLVWRLTNSELLLGVITFCQWIPNFFLSPVGGLLADRFNRFHILLTTQLVCMVQAFVIAGLVLTDTIQYWHLIALSLILGIANAVDIPARQSLVVQLIDDRRDLPNAIALNSTAVNLAQLIGPATAGVLIARMSEGMVFLLNALSYFGVLSAILLMTPPPMHQRPMIGTLRDQLVDGFRYSFGSPMIRPILVQMAAVGVLAMPYSTLMPIIAGKVFEGGADFYGLMMGATGLGALTGAITLAGRRGVHGLNRWVPRASSTIGVLLVLIGLSRLRLLTTLLLVGLGGCMIVQIAASNTILQTLVSEEQRGRVMSYFNLSFVGMVAFGNLLAGAVAHMIGAPLTLVLGGTCCLICARLLAPSIRRIELQ